MSRSAAPTRLLPSGGFSSRLNELLDVAGFKPLSCGRAPEIADIVGVSRIGSRKWLLENAVPKPATLEALVEAALSRGQITGFSTEDILAWLIYERPLHRPLRPEILEEDPLLVSLVYLSVNETANRLQIRLETISKPQLQRLYSALITNAHTHYRVDPVLVEQLLQLITA